ncbi:hypothetical protein ABIB00_003919 [Bradyrhizobium sp. LB14.3]|uniref:hypothetical protein n=1 Tax=Bradyrhizobium sp. LB14.3 TaxID=3156328 RepID=UPI003398C407
MGFVRHAPIDEQILASASRFDAAALHVVGRFLLWDLDDPSGARPYLQAAFERGNSEAAIDLAVIALLRA